MPPHKIRSGIRYNRGDSIKLHEIRVGDDITFSAPNVPSKSGVVARIMHLAPDKYGTLRKNAYLDERGYVLNTYPDQGIDASFTTPDAKQVALDEVTRAHTRKVKRSKQFRKFREAGSGTMYGDELSKYTNRIFVKVGRDSWVQIVSGPRGSFETYQGYTDLEVYRELLGSWDECYLRLPAPIMRGKKEED